MALDVGADPRRAWLLEVFAGNDLLLTRTIGGSDRAVSREQFSIDLSAYARRATLIRLYQRTLLPSVLPSQAHWYKAELR